MKKIILILIGIIFILPCVVFSDVSSPEIKTYKASVNNPDGVPVYKKDYNNNNYIETDLNAPYGTIFTIGWQEEDWGYVLYEIDEYQKDDDEYYVSLKDLTIIENKYEVKESELLPKEKALVLKDVVIKQGPAEGYESTGVTIKAGTKIDIRLFGEMNDDGEYEIDSSNPWIYVEYNNTKGFINSYKATVAYREFEEKMITDVDVELRDPKTNKMLKYIPANTEFSSNVFRLDDWSSSYYVIYDGTSGIAYTSAFVWEEEITNFTAEQKLNIYSKLYDDMEGSVNNLKTVGSVEEGDIFESSYYQIYNGCRIYYDDGNVKGWIYTEMDFDEDSDGECVGLVIGADIQKDPTEKDPDDEPYTDEPINDDPTGINEEPQPSDTPIKKTNSMTTLYVCIALAIVMAVVTLFVVKYINKKKSEGDY